MALPGTVTSSADFKSSGRGRFILGYLRQEAEITGISLGLPGSRAGSSFKPALITELCRDAVFRQFFSFVPG